MRSGLFKILWMLFIVALVLGATGGDLVAESAPTQVLESARQIPVAAEADVVVVGGSTGAVAAAIAAAQQGARVFLAAPRHYLGEDMAGTLQLWLEPGETAHLPLARSLFAQTQPPIAGLPLSYKADRPSVGKHKDTSPPSLLSDGRGEDPVHESVQYDDDVTIRIDLGRSQPLKSVRGVVFRGSDYGVQSMSVALCEPPLTVTDGLRWREVGQVKCDPSAPSPITVTLPLSDSARYLKCTFKKAAGARRILLGEIIVDSALPPKEPEELRTTTPLAVKRALDQALTDARVEFLYGCYATDLLQDGQGRPAGVVLANRSGRQAVLAKVVVDATPSAVLAHIAGATFQGPSQGALTVRDVVLAKETRPVSSRLAVRKLDMPVDGGRTRVPKGSVYIKDAAWYEYTLTLDLPDASWASRANLMQTVRDLTYTPSQLYSADEPCLVPLQTIRAVRPATSGPADSEHIKLDAFRPAGVPHLWVLGSLADVSRPQAEQLLHPMTLIEIGSRLGTAAAKEARELPAPEGIRVARSVGPAEPLGEIRRAAGRSARLSRVAERAATRRRFAHTRQIQRCGSGWRYFWRAGRHRRSTPRSQDLGDRVSKRTGRRRYPGDDRRFLVWQSGRLRA